MNCWLAFGDENLFIVSMNLSDSAYGLYLILTDPVTGYECCAQAAVDAGLRFLQLRMKGALDDEVIAMGKRLREITRDSETRLIMNDRVDIARAVDADGVHLGQDDLSLAEARLAWDAPGKLFGLSTHSYEQMQAAQGLAPDYIGIGPVFLTETKPDLDAPLGAVDAGRIAKGGAIPHVAIGGINTDNLPALLNAGVVNFCVVGAVNRAEDPASAICELMKIWREKYDR